MTTQTATDKHVSTIRARAWNDTTREMARTGILLTHEQADELGDEGLDWLRNRLCLSVTTDDRGVAAEVAEIGDDRINALRTAASEAGDMEQVAVCDRALDGDRDARSECEDILRTTDLRAAEG